MTSSENTPVPTSAMQPQMAASRSGRIGDYLATTAPTLFSLLTISTLLVLVWVTALLTRHPYSGLTWSYTNGAVQTVDPRGPAAALFQRGDRITAVDGTPVYAARDLPGTQAGQWVTFDVLEDGVESTRRLQLAAPPLRVLFSRLSPLLVAFSFWLLGALLLAFGRSSSLITLFVLFCQTFAALLGLGAISASGPLWSGLAFNFLLWWIAPLALQTHLFMAGMLSSRRQVRLFVSLYGLALLLSILDLWRLATPAPGLLVAIKTLWVGLHLLLSVAVLVLASRPSRPLPLRRRTGIAALAATLAFLPLALFSLLPNGLLGRPLLSYDITLLMLPLLPLGYVYAIKRQQLVRLEPYVNRVVAYALAAILAGALYGAFYLAHKRAVAVDERAFSPVEFAATALLIAAVPLMYRTLRRGVDRIFYGRWYDDRAAVQQISQSLAQAGGDVAEIGSALCLALLRVFQLESATLLLRSGQFVAASPITAATHQQEWDASQAAALLDAVAAETGETIGRGVELSADLPLSPDEKQQLLGRQAQLWLLLGARDRIHGLLVLGDKRGGGALSARDLQILEVVVRQTGAALENEYLLSELRQYSAQLRRLHRQIVQAREEERKRVARNLHDNTIQSLVGLNYRLAHTRRQAGAEVMAPLVALQGEVRAILGEVREVCLELRPPALDTLGLVPALQSHIAEVMAQTPLQIHLQADTLDGREIPDMAALTLYRSLQEALRNVQKHAAAQTVVVELEISADERLVLSVADDGRGFRPPPKLSTLTQDHHFGLVGLQEQVEALGGAMQVLSAPGRGCTLRVTVPLIEAGRGKQTPMGNGAEDGRLSTGEQVGKEP